MVQNVFTVSNDLYYTKGAHSLKFGTLINRYHQDMKTTLQTKGSITFPNIPQFLLARPIQISVAEPGSNMERRYFSNTFGFYAQDDWRGRTNFTLNLGLRYEFMTVPREQRGRELNLVSIRDDSGLTFTNGKFFENPSLRNFSPRFGFAWDVRGDGKTAVRGGFGLLYDVGMGSMANMTASMTQRQPPVSSQRIIGGPAAISAFTIPLTLPPATGAPIVAEVIDYKLEQPHTLHYNLTVERELPGDLALRAAYVGSRGINIMQDKEGNPRTAQVRDGRTFFPALPPPGSPYDRMNPRLDTITLHAGSGNSWYNALQLVVNKRLSKGLQFQSAYTWAKIIDEPQGQVANDDNVFNTIFPTDTDNRKTDRSVASFDLAHNWRTNAIYRLPDLVSSGGAAAKLMNGWWLSSILSLRTGYAVNPRVQSNRSRSGVSGNGTNIDRPDLVPGVKREDLTQGVSRGCGNIPAGTPVGTPERWFDPCAFTVQPEGFLGNAGRNIIRGPGLASFDFTVAKDTALGFLGESGKLEFRAEFFNILNRSNFAAPSTIVFTGAQSGESPLGNSGRINATSTTSRQIQLAVKIVF